MILNLDFGPLGHHTVELPNVTEPEYAGITTYLTNLITSKQMKAREAIADAFALALETCPDENPSDLFHHIIYRTYLKVVLGTNPEQSWVRTSGEALELQLTRMYNPRLVDQGILLTPLFSRLQKADVLRRMGIGDRVTAHKIDIAIERLNAGSGIGPNGYGVIGGIHAKGSVAERISDDIPASRIMMDNGFLSILSILDMKSFPPPHGDLVNRGEFGSPESPTDKRIYIERHGDFNACFSYNWRTVPSLPTTPSGRRVITVDPRKSPDEFMQFLQDAASNL